MALTRHVALAGLIAIHPLVIPAADFITLNSMVYYGTQWVNTRSKLKSDTRRVRLWQQSRLITE